MKIMVIGAKGQVGSEICALARLRKHQVLEAGRGAEYINDITSPYSFKEAFDKSSPEVVYSCAAEHRLVYCEENITTAYSVNAFALLPLIKRCEEFKSKLVYLSTDYVFPDSEKGWLDENEPARPLNIYGLSKQLGERLVLGYERGYVARLSHVYGHTRCKSKGANLIDRMVNSLKDAGKIETKNTEGGISLTYAKDAARMLLGVVQYSPRIYHCVNGTVNTVEGIAAQIAKLLGAPDSSVTTVPATPEELVVKRPANVSLQPSAELEGLNRPAFDALREYLADCGHCPY